MKFAVIETSYGWATDVAKLEKRTLCYTERLYDAISIAKKYNQQYYDYGVYTVVQIEDPAKQ